MNGSATGPYRAPRACLFFAMALAAVACDEPTKHEKSTSTTDNPERERSAGDSSSAEQAEAQEESKKKEPLKPVSAQLVSETMEAEAKATDGGVVKVKWPRDQVTVSVDEMAFPPPAGLTSWAGFAATDDGAMVMGDTVVFQDEVSPAMDAAFAHDLEITALHNHFFFDEPKVYFMHIGGSGQAKKLAEGVRAVWDAIRELRKEHPQPQKAFGGKTPTPGGSVDTKALEQIIGEKPKQKAQGVVKVTIPRTAEMHGTEFGGTMGLTTWAAFTGSDELCSIDGDFAMTAREVQPVLRALRKAGIHVVALHNHMVGEKPAYYFTHFWGKGSAKDLAQGFRSALDAQREAK